MRHTVAYSTVFPVFMNTDKHFRLVFSSLSESRFAHKICFPLSPPLRCQRLISVALSQLVLNALDLLFTTDHTDEWIFPDISVKAAVFHPRVNESGCYHGSLYQSVVLQAVGECVESDRSDQHPPHTTRCQTNIMAPDNVQVHSP
jgi:hypothetical protein